MGWPSDPFRATTPTVELNLSGCRRQPCGGEPVIDCLVDSSQGGTELGRGLRLADGEERGEHPVMDLGVEDRKVQPVGGQVVGAGMGRRVMSPLRRSRARS